MAEETPSKEWLDKERLLVERYRIKQETQRHSAEMVLRELELKQEAERLEVDRKKARSSRDPLIIGVIAAAFGLLANALVATIAAIQEQEALQTNAEKQLEQSIHNNQAQRILEALKTEGDTEKAIENLRLLAEAGLASSFEQGIQEYVANLDERRLSTENPNLGPGTATAPAASPVQVEGPIRMTGDELEFVAVGEGSVGPSVRRLQEWLTLHGIPVVLSNEFDLATINGLAEFSKRNGLWFGGEVTEELDKALKKPLHDVVAAKLDVSNMSIQDTIAAVARLHLNSHPREVGGANRGPWVRYYMLGNEGNPWAWTAGFVTRVILQAYQLHGQALPINGSFSVDSLVAQSKAIDAFLSEKAATENKPQPGDLFFLRRTSTDWVHTGIVVSVGPTSFQSIEGNTNDEGLREGDEVALRTRGFDKIDFAKLPPVKR